MPIFPWMRGAGRGIRRINEEHDLMLKLLDGVTSAVQTHDTSRAARAVHLFADATLLHFEHEETLMAELGYPFIKQHSAAHDAARKKVSGLVAAVCSSHSQDNALQAVAEIAATLHNTLFSDDVALVRFLDGKQAGE